MKMYLIDYFSNWRGFSSTIILVYILNNKNSWEHYIMWVILANIIMEYLQNYFVVDSFHI